MTTLTIQLTNCAVVPVYKGFVPLVHLVKVVYGGKEMGKCPSGSGR